MATRQKLIDIAREMFARDGFGAVTTTGLCEAAGVTRGALYHHFTNLTELMAAVFAVVELELVTKVERSLAQLGSPRERLLRAGPEFLRIVTQEPVTLRIVFVEAPAALGWTRWRALDRGRSLALVTALLDAADRNGDLRAEVDPRLTGQLLLGAINEAGMHVAETATPNRLARMQAQVELLVRGLLADG